MYIWKYIYFQIHLFDLVLNIRHLSSINVQIFSNVMVPILPVGGLYHLRLPSWHSLHRQKGSTRWLLSSGLICCFSESTLRSYKWTLGSPYDRTSSEFWLVFCILCFRGYIPIIWMDHLLWSHIVGVSGSDIRTPMDIVDIYRGYSQPWKRTEARSSPLLAEQFFTAFRQFPGGWKYKFEMLFVYLVFSSSLQLQILFFWSCKLFLLFWNLH